MIRMTIARSRAVGHERSCRKDIARDVQIIRNTCHAKYVQSVAKCGARNTQNPITKGTLACSNQIASGGDVAGYV